MTIKILAKSIRQYKKDTVLASLLMIVEVIVEVLVPFLMASFIDYGISAGNMSYVTRMGTILMALALLALAFGILSGSFAASSATGYAANLRADVFRGIQRFSFSNIDRFSSASLITRLTTDVQNVMMAYQFLIRQAVRSVCMVGFSLVMAFSLDARIALIFVAVSPVLAFSLFFLTLKAHPFFLRALSAYDRMNAVVQENLLGIRIVKSFVREKEEKKKFGGVSQEVRDHFVGGQSVVALNMPLIQFFNYLCVLLIAWFGARFIVSDTMSTGDLTSLFTYVMQILISLLLMSLVFVQIIIARSSAQRIVEVLREEPGIKAPDNPVTEVKDGSVDFRSVSFSYIGDKSKLCLMDTNLSIAAGETIGIIGATGSSKTSLVQLIPRLYDVTEGELLVGGVDVRNYDLDTLRAQVAMVLQKNLLFSGTISENLRWGDPDASDEELRRACDLAQASGFIDSFPDGFDTHIEEGGSNVSGGQRQRLCIARALVKKPKILILDDSTSAVDTRTDALIRKALREDIPDTTKIIIAQRIASVMDADRIVVMDEGRVIALGSHEELLAGSEIYREVYQTQTQAGGDFDE